MKMISCNVNGIRSAYNKGLIDFIAKENPDILCLQEVKACRDDLCEELLNISGYYLHINSAVKKGYSGVAVYSKHKPISVNFGLGLERFDSEGRCLELEYDDFVLLNLYMPHGGRQKENLEYKLDVYNKLFERTKILKTKNIILMGDFNIAHNEIDLSRPKQNKNNIMFSAIEREQLDNLVTLGFVDSFRSFYKETGNYTWWPYAFNAKERNMGWRIDYGFISDNLAIKITDVNIYPDANLSDHCPIGLNLVIS